MFIEFDADKRAKTLAERGLDFARAGDVFADKHWTREDARENDAATRFQAAGWLDGQIVMRVWTPRGEARRIISMRKANEREINEIGLALG